jgi:hypothetical protein
MQIDESMTERQRSRTLWSKDKLIGAKPPLRAKHRLVHSTQGADRRSRTPPAHIQSAVDSKLRGGDVVNLKVETRDRASEEHWTAGQSQAALCHKLTFHAGRNHKLPHHASSSSKALACFKSNVSKPSMNQP